MFKAAVRPIGLMLGLGVSIAACVQAGTPQGVTGGTTTDDGVSRMPSAVAAKARPVKLKPQSKWKEPVKLKTLVRDTSLNVAVTNFTCTGGDDPDHDGRLDYRMVADVQAPGGTLGVQANDLPHTIAFAAQVAPVQSDKPDSLTVKDLATGNVRIYSVNYEMQQYTISDGKSSLKIMMNPDGTMMVRGKPATSYQEAAKLILQSPLGSEASLEGLAGTYGVALRMYKGSLSCIGPSPSPASQLQTTWFGPIKTTVAAWFGTAAADNGGGKPGLAKGQQGANGHPPQGVSNAQDSDGEVLTADGAIDQPVGVVTLTDARKAEMDSFEDTSGGTYQPFDDQFAAQLLAEVIRQRQQK